MKNFITQAKPYGFYGMKATTLWRWCFGLVFLLTGLSSYGQVATNRVFGSTTGTYTPITGGTVLVTQTNNSTTNAGSLDDATVYTVTLPFTFTYDGAPYTEMTVSNNMSVSFGGTPIGSALYTPISSTGGTGTTAAAYTAAISVYGRDMQGGYVFGGTSTIGSPILTLGAGASTAGVTVGSTISGTGIPPATTVIAVDATTVTMSANATAASTNTARWVWNGEMRHETLGTPGNQIFVVQWSNMKPFGQTLTTVNGFRMNAQLRIHEQGNKIEIVYGTCTPGVATSTATAQVGLRGPNNTFATNVNNRLVTKNVHDWATSAAGTANTSGLVFNNVATANVIPSGLTYSWSQPSTDTMDWQNIQWVAEQANQANGSNTSFSIQAGNPVIAYAQGYEAGITDPAGAGTGVEAWIGYSTTNNDPSLAGWTWVAASFANQSGNNDEFSGILNLPAATYYVASRWRLNNGPFTYGGFNGPWNGTGNNSIELIVTPNPTQCATDPVPASGTTGVPPGTVTLNWTAPTTGPTPTSYQVWGGATSGALALITTVATTTVNVVANAFESTLFWEIRPVSVVGGIATGCAEWSFTTGPAPQGTYCADPIVVTPGAYTTGAINIGGGKLNAAAPCNTTAGTGSHARWYSYTAPADGFMRVKSCTVPDNDTNVTIFSGDCGSLSCVGQNDDEAAVATACHASGWNSLITVAVTNGTEYKIQWDNRYNTASLDWTLEFQESPSATMTQATGEINYATAFPVTSDLTVTGLTDPAGQAAGVTASVGMSFTNTDPSTWNNTYSWKSLTFSSQYGGADRYTGNVGPQYQDGMGNDVWFWSPGVYYYAARFVEGANTYYSAANGKLKIRTEVRASQNGLTYNSLTTAINAISAVGATGYTFEFVNGSNTYFVNSSTPATNFAALGANAVNGAWTIRVRADLAGGETIEYGAARTITLNNTVGLPQLRPTQCGLVVPGNNPGVVLNAVPVSGASQYRFGVTVNGGTEQTVTTATPSFTFGQLPNGVPGHSSIIAIRVQALSSGVWTLYGTSCNVTTPTQITRVRPSQCNGTYPNLGSTTINAVPVVGATAYQFGVTINGGAEQILTLTTSFLKYSDLPSLPGIGATIAIRVRASVNGIEGVFGLSCNVFTPAPADEDFSQNLSSNEEMTAYPNPFTNQFTLKLVSNTEASIQIFDINGRLVSNQVVNDSYDVELGQNLTSGVYLVRVEQNNETQTFKMIKK